jgi:transcriptional regulator with PAS, ATPase and Fis domain
MAKDNTITVGDLPALKAKVVEKMDWIAKLPIGKKMRDVEVHFILETLKNHQGNRTHAAKTLGISLRTLRNKINEFTAMGLEVPTPPTGRTL